MSAAWIGVFWQRAVIDGVGEERIAEGRVITYLPIDDAARVAFPEIPAGAYVAVWTDEKRRVFAEVVDRVPADDGRGHPRRSEGG